MATVNQRGRRAGPRRQVSRSSSRRVRQNLSFAIIPLKPAIGMTKRASSCARVGISTSCLPSCTCIASSWPAFACTGWPHSPAYRPSTTSPNHKPPHRTWNTCLPMIPTRTCWLMDQPSHHRPSPIVLHSCRCRIGCAASPSAAPSAMSASAWKSYATNTSPPSFAAPFAGSASICGP